MKADEILSAPHSVLQPLPDSLLGYSGHLAVRRRPTATRKSSNGGGEARWAALAALPGLGSRMLSASAALAYVALGAAAILSRSVAEAARDALAWVLARDGERRRNEEVGPRA